VLTVDRNPLARASTGRPSAARRVVTSVVVAASLSVVAAACSTDPGTDATVADPAPAVDTTPITEAPATCWRVAPIPAACWPK
jgi:hypothetical protein